MNCRYYTEAEAKRKWCPSMSSTCCGPTCMLWTWVTTMHKNTLEDKVESGAYRSHWKTGEPVGYCGMKEVA